MFINNIVNKSIIIKAHNSNKIVTVYDNIILYNNCNSLLNARYKVKREYKYKDDNGRYYRLGNMGGRQKKNYLKNNKNFIVVNNQLFQKIYKTKKDCSSPYDNWWELGYSKTLYPTQKPYRLMERIILLSTI